MTEKDLGRALLELDSQRLSGVADIREQTWKILQRDQNRVWWWTAITFTIWGFAIFMVALVMVHFALIMPLQAKLHGEEALARIGIQADNMTPEMREESLLKTQILFQMTTVGVAFSVGLTCMAVLSSVLLSRASRRATLRQINASLLEISEQLKELRKASPPPTAS